MKYMKDMKNIKLIVILFFRYLIYVLSFIKKDFAFLLRLLFKKNYLLYDLKGMQIIKNDIKKYFIIVFFIGVFSGFSLCLLLIEKNVYILEDIYDDEYIIGSEAWKDSIFNEYKKKAEIYLSQEKYSDVPINAEMLTLAARNTYDSTGILVPLELVFAQLKIETNMGRVGKSPKNNPFNIGEYDNKTIMYFDEPFKGVQKYYYVIASNYLKCKDIHHLLKNFSNCNNYRYASDSLYEEKISSEYYKIKKWLIRNYKKTNNF